MKCLLNYLSGEKVASNKRKVCGTAKNVCAALKQDMRHPIHRYSFP